MPSTVALNRDSSGTAPQCLVQRFSTVPSIGAGPGTPTRRDSCPIRPVRCRDTDPSPWSVGGGRTECVCSYSFADGDPPPPGPPVTSPLLSILPAPRRSRDPSFQIPVGYSGDQLSERVSCSASRPNLILTAARVLRTYSYVVTMGCLGVARALLWYLSAEVPVLAGALPEAWQGGGLMDGGRWTHVMRAVRT